MKKSRELCKKEWVDWAIKNGLNLTREEVEAQVQKYNDIITQTVPFNDGLRLKPRSVGMASNSTDRMTKWRTDSIYSPKDLNLHDPHEMYKWADEGLPLWVLPLYLLGGCAFGLGIGYLVFLGVLL